MGNLLRFIPLSTSYLGIAVRWTARLLAAFLVGIVLVTFFGVGGFNPLKLTAVEAIQMLLFLATCLWMTAAWRWELIGGAIATAAIVSFFAVEFVVTGGFPKGLTFLLMLLPGLLFLLSGVMTRLAGVPGRIGSS
jgi:hypothetical protein